MNKFLKFIIHKIKNLDKSIELYKNKTQNVIVPSKAYLNWGINLAIEGKINDALEKFEMSANMPCNDPENYTNWGIALAKLHKYKEAIEKFNEALYIDKTYSSAYSLKGAALVELNKYDEAIDCYHLAVKYAPFDPEIYVNWGVALARLNQKNKAEIQFRKALGLSLTHVNASFLLGVVQYEQNKLQEALASFNYTIKLDSKHVMAFYYLSLINTKLGKFNDALNCAIITVQLSPFKIDFMVNLAECYYDVGNLKQVLKTYKAIEVIAPDNFALLISKGIFWQKVKKFDKSLKYLENAMQKQQADYLTKYYFAIALAGLKRYTEAKETLSEIIKLKPDFYDAHLKLAIIYKICEEYDIAIEIFEKYIPKSIFFAKSYNILADCYKQKANLDKAVYYYKKMLEYYPTDTEAQIELAQIYFNHYKDIKNALRIIRNAYKNNKDTDVKINTLFALILAADNSFDNALEKIEAAINLNPTNLETYLRKIYILKKAQYNERLNDCIRFVTEKFSEKAEYIQTIINSY